VENDQDEEIESMLSAVEVELQRLKHAMGNMSFMKYQPRTKRPNLMFVKPV